MFVARSLFLSLWQAMCSTRFDPRVQLVNLYVHVQAVTLFNGADVRPQLADPNKKVPTDAIQSFKSSRRAGFANMTNAIMASNFIVRGGARHPRVCVWRWLEEATTAALLAGKFLAAALPLMASALSTTVVLPSPFELTRTTPEARGTEEYVAHGYNVPRCVVHEALAAVFTPVSAHPADINDIGPAGHTDDDIIDMFCKIPTSPPVLTAAVHTPRTPFNVSGIRRRIRQAVV